MHGFGRGHGVVGTVLAVVAMSAVWAGVAPARATPASACPSVSYGLHRYAPGSGKVVALTFDDGPGRSTARIIRILSDAHVEAAFFNIGASEAGAGSVVHVEQRHGFTLGDHTWDHQDLTTLDAPGQASEIDRERAKEASITGAYPCLLRPPNGSYNSTTLHLAQERGMRVWDWSVDTEDWKAAGSDDQYWVDRIVSRAEAGGEMRNPVILMHNQAGGNPATVQALPTIIRYYKARGYRFVDLYGRTGHPVVKRRSTTSGRTTGGTRVTVTGHGFLGVLAVRFGAGLGTSIKVESNTRLLVTSPRHRPGVVNIRVVTTFGTSPLVAADRFRYLST